MPSKFARTLKNKTDSELLEYLNNRNLYQQEAILSVIDELESRGKSNSNSNAIKTEINDEIELKETVRESNKAHYQVAKDLPISISSAVKVIYFSAVLGLINPLIIYLAGVIENFPNLNSLIIIILSTSLVVFLGFQVHCGKKWARTVFLVFYLVGLIPSPLVILDSFRLSPLIGILSLAQVVVQGYALILLYRPSSKEWYLKHKNSAVN